VAVGSFRYKVTFAGPGGHSYGAFGMPNPIHAMGRAIAKISEFKVAARPKTTFNVGRVGGGTSVNAIPFEAWMEVDMRSSDPASLKAVDEQFKVAVDQAAGEENTRWHREGVVKVNKELVGNRPAGQTSEEAPLVRTVVALTKALGAEGRLGEGSTDSNIPMSMGIPAVTIAGGGQGSGAHAPDESFDITDSWKGTQRALLVVLALTEK
jgi:acetylornithine deacetylase/succinyl-diaminopimelate desuccinylase-like protein